MVGPMQMGISGNNAYEENIYNVGSGLRRGPYHSSSTTDMPIISSGSPDRGSPSGLGENERPSVKLHAPPGGKSSLNLGGYGGAADEDIGVKKISKLRTGGRQNGIGNGNLSAMRQYELNGPNTVSRAISNNISSNIGNSSYPNHYQLNAPRNHNEQLSPQIGGNSGIKKFGYHSNTGQSI